MANARAAKTAEESQDMEKVPDNAVAVMPSLKSRARQDAVAQATSLGDLREVFGDTITSWEEIEPQFEVIKDKALFEGIPVVVGAFRFNQSNKFVKMVEDNTGKKNPVPAEFVSMLLAAYDPESETLTSPWVIVNDGGTGIKEQLETYAARYGDDPLKCPPIKVNGFRRSEYPYTDAEGNISTATTWYLS
jgi:hypothetical protein